MRPEKRSLYELFDRQRLHVIPLFQRPYVWSEEKQWRPLWEDIEDRAVAVLHQNQTRSRENLRSHFLGAIVTSQVRTYGRQIDRREVIDGQQRMTTLQVFLAAFRDLVAATEEHQMHRDLVNLTENGGVMAHDEERFKVWPTNADRAVFARVMAAGSPKAVREQFPQVRRKYARRPDPRPPLVEAYLFFSGRLEEFCRGGPEGTRGFAVERGDAMFEALRRHVQVVQIDLEDDDDPQVIFETLNARGEPLLPSDLIRNHIFLRAGRQGKDPAQLYESLWKDYDERAAEDTSQSEARFWKRYERQGRYTRPRLDLFLFHYIQMQRGEEVAMGLLYQEFRKWWGEDRDVEDGLRELRRHSDGFAGLFAPKGSSREALFAQRLKALDTSTVYPVALYLLVNGRERVSPGDLDAILADIESYLVRRTICDATAKNYNRFFLGLLTHLKKADTITRAVVKEYLAGATGDSAWPDDKAFERGWLHSPVYDDIPVAKVAMVLRALEHHATTGRQEGVRLPALTVEHVMPVAWSTHWSTPEPLPADATEDATERRNRLLHTFGNLTLLTQALNSSVSNGPYEEKRREIAMQSQLRLNAYFQERPAWNEEAILARGRALFETAKRIWPSP